MNDRAEPASLLPRARWPLMALSLVTAAAFGVYLAAGRGLIDFQGYALGRDFVNVWTAGHLVREGRAAAVFDPQSFLAAARRLFDPRLSFHFWSYPPPTLLMAAPLGWTSYAVGLVAWTALGLAALAAALSAFARTGRIAAGWLLWLALLGPASLTNIGLGQNGAFSAAALIGGLAWLERRPWAAGLLLGLLVLKPQIALLLPVVVFAGRRWRVLAGAALSATALVAVSLLLYGPQPWAAFVARTLPMQTRMLRHGLGPFQTMMPSAYMAARALGWRWPWAAVAQLPFTFIGVWLVWRAWRRPVEASLRAGVLMAATFVASPQAFNYDLLPTAVAALLLWRRDASAIGTSIALAAWVLPAAMAASILPEVQRLWRAAPLAPLVLAALALRLDRTALPRLTSVSPPPRPPPQPASRAASAVTAAESASNT